MTSATSFFANSVLVNNEVRNNQPVLSKEVI